VALLEIPDDLAERLRILADASNRSIDAILTDALSSNADFSDSDQKRTLIELARSNERFRGLFENNLDGVLIVDLDSYIQDANQRAADMLGYTVEELIGTWTGSYNQATEERRKWRFEALQRGEPVPIHEETFVRRDGSTFPVELNVAVVRDSAGNPSHYQALIHDITARKRMEDALRESEARYRALFE
jgi:PAS domain S-box-containing protein